GLAPSRGECQNNCSGVIGTLAIRVPITARAAIMGRMDSAELTHLLTPEGLRLLDSLPPYDSKGDVVRMVSELRGAGHPPALVAAVLTQARLRHRALAKFGPFAERMLFTEAGLEQATRLSVAARHAERFRTAGVTRVADL